MLQKQNNNYPICWWRDFKFKEEHYSLKGYCASTLWGSYSQWVTCKMTIANYNMFSWFHTTNRPKILTRCFVRILSSSCMLTEGEINSNPFNNQYIIKRKSILMFQYIFLMWLKCNIESMSIHLNSYRYWKQVINFAWDEDNNHVQSDHESLVITNSWIPTAV